MLIDFFKWNYFLFINDNIKILNFQKIIKFIIKLPKKGYFAHNLSNLEKL